MLNIFRRGLVLSITILLILMALPSMIPIVKGDNPSVNLLVNPGFESGIYGWNFTKDSTTWAISSDSKVGSHSIKGTESNKSNLGRLYQNFTDRLIPGTRYKIGGWIKTQNVQGSVVIALDYVAANGWCPIDGYIKEIGYVSGTHDWYYYESNWFTLPSMPQDCKMLWFLFDFNLGNGTAYWDNVFLYGAIKPTANAGDDIIGYVGENIHFDGSNSYDADGNILSYEWNFGDGNISYGKTTTHTYSECRTYIAILTVTDDQGNSDTDTIWITIKGRGFSFCNSYGHTEQEPFNFESCFYYLESDFQEMLEADPFWQDIFSLYPDAEQFLISLIAGLVDLFHTLGHCFGMSSLVVRYHDYPSELSKDYIYDLKINDVDNTGYKIYDRIDEYQNGLVYSAVKFLLLYFDRLNNQNEVDEIIDSGFPCAILLRENVVSIDVLGFEVFVPPAIHAVVAYDYDTDEKTFSIYDPNYPDLDSKIIFSDENNFEYSFPGRNLKFNKLASPSYTSETIFNVFIDFLVDSLFILGECPINISVYDSGNNLIGESFNIGEKHLVVVPGCNNGSYQIKVNGEDVGLYNLTIMKFLNDTFLSENFSGTIEKEQITTYTIDVNDTIYVVNTSHYFPPKPEKNTPGFELIILFCSITLLLLLKRKRKL